MNETLIFPARGARPLWDLLVVGSREVGDGLRRVSLVGDDLEGFVFRPGQLLTLSLPGGRAFERRRFVIVGSDREELRLEVEVPRGDAPAERGAVRAQIGDPIRAEAPVRD